MEVTDVKITKADKGAIKAWGSITVDNEFVIHGIKIIEVNGKKFIAMPSRKTKEGGFLDICHPIKESLREHICKMIFEKYEKLNSEKPEF